MNAQFHCMVGLPRTGKTTFLAALWHLLGASEVPSELILERLEGDHAHLNAISNAWLGCDEMARSSRLNLQFPVTMHLKQPASGQTITLRFPDLAGESFESQFASRKCKPDYLDGYEQPGGLLLFVNADRGSDGMTIVEVGTATSAVEEEIKIGEAAPAPIETTAEKINEWSAEDVPEQVRLVDLLQFLQRAPFTRRRRRLAVIVSAWDVIADANLTPSQWLAREMPFLHQFLSSNSQAFESRVYGVSAQGGSVKGEVREKLLRMVPSERLLCVGPESRENDLTVPIMWLGSEG